MAWADQVDGSPLGADASMRWMPSGTTEDPAVTYYVRDKDQSNLRQETLARSGTHDDGLQYPVFQFSHEGNNSNGTLNGTSAIIGGDFYSGFWAEELEGQYLFGNISTDQIFFGQASALDAEVENAEVNELSLVDTNGDPTNLATIVGNSRANMRFGKDRYGNLYLASKTNGKLYRFQGTPELSISAETVTDGLFEFTLERPPADESITYIPEVSEDLAAGFVAMESEDYEIVSVEPLATGMERVTFRCLLPVDPTAPRFFRINWQ